MLFLICKKKKTGNVSRCYPFCMVSTLYGNLIWKPVWAGKGEPAVAERSFSGNKRANIRASRGDDKERVQTLIKTKQ